MRERSRWLRVAGQVLLGAGMACAAWGQGGTDHAPARLTIDPGTIVSPVSPMLYGLMTEEINHALDGGLYAELLNNRTFRPTWQGVQYWDLVRLGEAKATMTVDRENGPSKALPYSVRITVTSAPMGSAAGLVNSGFWGMEVRPRTTYHGSFYAKVQDAGVGPVRARLIQDKTGAVLAEASVPVHAGEWTRYEYALTTGGARASKDNYLELTVAHTGSVWMQLASLMPPTFAGRANGNRADLMEKMAEMHPAFLRLPGGNYLEGDHINERFNWKETTGPLVDRPGHQAPWSYWSTDGLGLLEFLEWCEDLKMEPVLAVYAGYSLHGEHVAAGAALESYVQSALDEVEYVTGDATTPQGAQRVRDGHPAPFALHYIEIGNEDEFDKSKSYGERFAQFAKALHGRYPQYKLIATTPVQEKDADAQPDVIDDHYYKSWGEMLDFTHHYDKAPRNGPKIFVGEWATLSGWPTPDFGGALADAAWMTSMERNSDLIVMSAYAPLLVNVNANASQWGTNLIGYDAERTYGSPSYYAQVMFGAHLGDGTPKSEIERAGERFFYSATVDTKAHVLHLKLVNASDQPQGLRVEVAGGTGLQAARVWTLHGATYKATNSLADPDAIRPVETRMTIKGGTWTYTVPGLTIQVLDLPLQ